KLVAAIATGKFPGESIEKNLAFAIGLVEKAARAGAQVVCLPETITTWRTGELSNEGARPIPGPESDALCESARRLRIDIVCSIMERDGDGLIYNTGLYIDADEGITGKYRKVHLAVGERWKGITPGSEFPVWDTSYGKAGMLICYDNVHPEGHRILAQKGAEVLFLPIMGDPRAVGDEAYENWLRIMQVRAMDNHVWFVVCQNRGEWGMIIRPDGKIVARVNPESGLALIELDLNFRFESWIGSDFQNRNWGERRPNLYRELIEDR
ncbi:MAG: carbon-nitrogen hydrolase family protein, partial [Verrucomicrobiales bacterium]